MHLERLLGSDVRVKVLRTLFQEGLPRLDAPALVQETGRSRAGVHLALSDLLATRIVQEEARGRARAFGVDPGHPQFAPLFDVFRDERQRSGVPHLFPTLWNHLEIALGRLLRGSDAQAVLLFGSLTRPPVYPDADVDLLVVAPRRVAVELPDVAGHSVQALVLRDEALRQKLAEEDAFLQSALVRYVVLHQAPGYVLPWLEPRAKRRRRR